MRRPISCRGQWDAQPAARCHLRRHTPAGVGVAQVRGRLDSGDPQHLGRADRPRRAEYDRGATRRDVTRSRSRSTAAAAATISDQTIVVPLGGDPSRRRDGPPSASATGRRCGAVSAARTGCSRRTNGVVDIYRWLPWVSRRLAFDRPNHGDPFETPTSPFGEGQDRHVSQARVRDLGRPRVDRPRWPDPGLRRPRTCATSR